MTFVTFGATSYDLSNDIESVQLVTQYDDVYVEKMDTVLFGSYPQSDATGKNKEHIEWVVLERDKINREALLLSKYILDAKCYDNRAMNEDAINWDNCLLKEWLNNEFIDADFDNDDKMRIIEKSYSYNDRSWSEKVSLMDYNELKKYFPAQSSLISDLTDAEQSYIRTAMPTAYATNKGLDMVNLENASDVEKTITKGLNRFLEFSAGLIGSSNFYKGERLFQCCDYWLCSYNNKINI